MARALGHVVVAEGIERPEEAAALRALGCELGQGFLFSRPVPAEEAAALLRPSPRRGDGPLATLGAHVHAPARRGLSSAGAAPRHVHAARRRVRQRDAVPELDGRRRRRAHAADRRAGADGAVAGHRWRRAGRRAARRHHAATEHPLPGPRARLARGLRPRRGRRGCCSRTGSAGPAPTTRRCSRRCAHERRRGRARHRAAAHAAARARARRRCRSDRLRGRARSRGQAVPQPVRRRRAAAREHDGARPRRRFPQRRRPPRAGVADRAGARRRRARGRRLRDAARRLARLLPAHAAVQPPPPAGSARRGQLALLHRCLAQSHRADGHPARSRAGARRHLAAQRRRQPRRHAHVPGLRLDAVRGPRLRGALRVPDEDAGVHGARAPERRHGGRAHAGDATASRWRC